MKNYFCKWCSKEIIHEETRVGGVYCSKACQVADLGHDGIKKQEEAIQAEKEKKAKEDGEQAAGGCCLLIFLLLFVGVLFAVVEIFS